MNFFVTGGYGFEALPSKDSTSKGVRAESVRAMYVDQCLDCSRQAVPQNSLHGGINAAAVPGWIFDVHTHCSQCSVRCRALQVVLIIKLCIHMYLHSCVVLHTAEQLL